MDRDTVVWLPNALVLTAILASVAVWRWRRKGALSGLRWTGVAMLPLSLYAVGLFKLGWSVGLAVSRFVTGFAWRPSVWLGLVMLAVAAALIMLPPRFDRRLGGSRAGRPGRQVTGSKGADSGDSDLAEIQDILKKHGIG